MQTGNLSLNNFFLWFKLLLVEEEKDGKKEEILAIM